VHSRSINKNKLCIWKILYAGYFVSGRLRFIGNYRNFIADNSIEECGFTHVRAANDAYEAGFKQIIISR
jgi:hypothetical protein